MEQNAFRERDPFIGLEGLSGAESRPPAEPVPEVEIGANEPGSDAPSEEERMEDLTAPEVPLDVRGHADSQDHALDRQLDDGAGDSIVARVDEDSEHDVSLASEESPIIVRGDEIDSTEISRQDGERLQPESSISELEQDPPADDAATPGDESAGLMTAVKGDQRIESVVRQGGGDVSEEESSLSAVALGQLAGAPVTERLVRSGDVEQELPVVRDGELVHERPELPFDRVLDGQRVDVFVDDRELADMVVFEQVLTGIEDLREQPGRFTILVVDLEPGEGENKPLLVSQQDPQWYKVIEVNIADPDGVLGTLETDQLAEVLANAVDAQDEKIWRAYKDIIRKVSRPLEREVRNPDTGEIKVLAPSPLQVRDALRVLRSTRIGEDYPDENPGSLSRDEQKAVNMSMGRTVKGENSSLFEPLGQFLDQAIPDTDKVPGPDEDSKDPNQEQGTSPDSVYGDYRPPGEVTVVYVTVRGYGGKLRAQRSLASSATLPLVAENTAWGEPKKVVVIGADSGEKAALKELFEISKGQKIPVVATADEFDEETSWVVGKSQKVIAAFDAKQAAVVSEMLGKVLGSEVSGRTNGVHANEGYQGGTTLTREKEEGQAKLKSSASSGTNSDGLTYDYTENQTVGELPRLKQSEIEAIPPGQIVVTDERGNSLGLYDVRSRARVGDYPPPKPEPLDVRDRIRAVDAAQQARNEAAKAEASQYDEQAGGEDGSTHGGEIPSPKVPQLPPEMREERKLELPAQEKKRLEALYAQMKSRMNRYFDDHLPPRRGEPVHPFEKYRGRKMMFTFREFCQTQYYQERYVQRTTNEDWGQWSRRRGVPDGRVRKMMDKRK